MAAAAAFWVHTASTFQLLGELGGTCETAHFNSLREGPCITRLSWKASDQVM